MKRISAQIADGIALLPAAPAGTSDVNAYYRDAIQNVQLKYIVGLMRDMRATIGNTDSASIDSNDFRITAVNDGVAGLKEVHYALSLEALWPLTTPAPAALNLVVPGRSDTFTQNSGNDVDTSADRQFFAAFGALCLIPDGGAAPTAGQAWYHYNPARVGCPLVDLAHSAPGASKFTDVLGMTFAQVALTFGASVANSGKHPDYAGLWRDNMLRVLIVSTPVGADASDPSDISVRNLQTIQTSMAARFHEVSRTTDGVGASGMPLQTTVTYDVGQGRILELAILHADGFWGSDAGQFFGKIAALSGPASVVYYAGHSSYGSAIRRLSDLVEVRPHTAQIYYIDGCSTYFYSGQSVLWDRIRAANPGPVPPGRWANLIVNGDAEFADANGPNLSALLVALVGQTASYRQIMATLGHDSRPVVIGEENNPN